MPTNDKLEEAKAIVVEHDFKLFSEFVMSLKGGDLPKEYDENPFYIKTVIGYDGATNDQFVEWCSAGSSRRVTLQNTLRKKCTLFTISRCAREGLAIHANKVDDVPKTPKEQRLETIAYLRSLKSSDPAQFKSMLEELKTNK